MVFNTKNRKLVGLEKLLYEIFQAKTYNKFVRPTNNITGLTHVQTQLKLLQIDLVNIVFNYPLWILIIKGLFFNRTKNTKS